MKLRNIGILALSCFMVSALTSCDLLEKPIVQTTEEKPTATPTPKPTKDPNKIYSHDEFLNAKDREKLKIEGYIQEKQIYNAENKMTTLYIQDDNGGYMVYGLPCTKEQYDNDLAIGQRVRISGEKMQWHGQHEVVRPRYTKLEGSKLYDPVSFDDLKSETLGELAGTKVKFNNLTVIEVQEIPAGETDLYYQVTDGDVSLTFCVESDLCQVGSEEYINANSIKPGDVISAEGMMFIYNTPQLHTTKIVKTGVNVLEKSEGSISYADYVKAEVGSVVTIEAFIQAKQTFYEGHTNLYLADGDGAYYAYKLYCSKEDFDTKLVPGTRIVVTGKKAHWNGLDEIVAIDDAHPATYKILPGKYRAPIKDLTKSFESDELVNYSMQYVSFTGLKVSKLHEIDGADLYYDVEYKDKTLTFCVESYLTGPGSDVYKTVKNDLRVGDTIMVEGFLFIYNNKPQLHTTSCFVLD